MISSKIQNKHIQTLESCVNQCRELENKVKPVKSAWDAITMDFKNPLEKLALEALDSRFNKVQKQIQDVTASIQKIVEYTENEGSNLSVLCRILTDYSSSSRAWAPAQSLSEIKKLTTEIVDAKSPLMKLALETLDAKVEDVSKATGEISRQMDKLLYEIKQEFEPKNKSL